MTLSTQSRAELTWWVNYVLTASKSISHRNPDLTLTTNALNVGWGAVRRDTSSVGFWILEEQRNHINFLELKVVLLGLKSLCGSFSEKHMLIQSGNTTTVAYKNAVGIKSIPCNDMTTMIWEWCQTHNIWLRASHIPGSENIQAHKESRVLKQSIEWSYPQEVFTAIQERWGMFDIDLSASRLNLKVPQYVSWRPAPETQFINAFLVNWKPHYFKGYPTL